MEEMHDHTRKKIQLLPKPIRLGYVPLCDCAPLVMAKELGLYEKHGLRVHLTREVGWATIRDKIIYRELDAAHALAPMVFAANFGLGSVQTDCVAGLVLGVNGNAITLSLKLREEGVRDGHSLRTYARRKGEALVFGIPFNYSSHHFLLYSWLKAHGLSLERDVQLVVVPPPQMPANLKGGHLDGYCVGEPWNSVAALSNHGWQVASSADIAPMHPEKVLMVRQEFADAHGEEHERLIAALYEACRFCDAPENRERIIETLGEPRYLTVAASALRNSFSGAASVSGATDPLNTVATHEPSEEKAKWVMDHMKECGLLPEPPASNSERSSKIFRADIFHAAVQHLQQCPTPPTHAISRN